MTGLLLILLMTQLAMYGLCSSGYFCTGVQVGSMAPYLNSAHALVGLTVVVDSYFMQRAFRFWPLSLLVALTGAGFCLFGVFSAITGSYIHVSSSFGFVAMTLAALASYKVQGKPFSYVSLLFGTASLVMLLTYLSGNFLGLGQSGMEFVMGYVLLVWALSFGGYILGISQSK